MGKKQRAAAAAAPAPGPEEAESSTAPAAEPRLPVEVIYCGVCGWPLEYCEFGSTFTRCKEWLGAEHSELFDKYYSEDALAAKLGTISLEAQSKLEEDTAKKEAKAEARAEAELKKKMESQVVIKRVERTKRKHVTVISGLDKFGIDLKKAAKQFASKFATGASVSKVTAGATDDEIVVQGDVCYEILEMIEDGVGILKGVPADNVEIVEDKKKKGGN
ncbi:density-regulated protein DRP1 [Coprinellus micaceus]|uniref:Translation machinery-associated protein 22 n=1 Tax=Coprinellus micaceus TaxID=71717 RepID=A0A4Y7ST72_COPMI|nr:density-regulated protein DRP1 [Coprinellus micaceus]